MRLKTALALALLALALPLLSCSGRSRPALEWEGGGRRWFDAEVLSGFDAEGRPAATLTVSVPWRSLVFFREAEGYRAGFTVRAIQRRDGEALRAEQWSAQLTASSYEETRGGRSERRTWPLRLLEGGEGPLELRIVVEVEGTQRQAARRIVVRPAARGEGGVALAELQLYRLEDPFAAAGDSTLAVAPGQPPDPARFDPTPAGSVFDLASGPPWLLVRSYDLAPDPPAARRATVRVREPEASAPRYEHTLELPRGEGVEVARLWRLPPSALAFGENILEVEVEGAGQRDVRLVNRGLEPADDRSWRAIVDQLEPIAGNDELRRLRELPPDRRAEGFATFWRRRDPAPQTVRNERLEEHYRRVSIARRRYRDGFEDGARSDRGRVFIRHGEPDLVEELSRSDGFGNYELWGYQDQGWRYWFYDSDGLGRFRLVHRERR